MMITNNIKEDIENAAEWFKKNLEILPLDKIAKQEEGVVSYSLWEAEHKSSNLIVLIHGTGAHKKWWYPIAPSLRKNSNVIALDLPGMGDSDHRESYTMSNFGDAITDIIEKEKSNLDVEKILIVGHSLGGHLAGYVSTVKKELIQGLIIIDTFIKPPDYDYEKAGNSGPLRMIKYYPDKLSILNRFRLMPKQECNNNWYLRYIAEHSIKEDAKGWRWKFDDGLFHRIQKLWGFEFAFDCPTLFLYGSESLLIRGEILKHISKTYGDKMHLREIKDAGHHVPLDQPLELIGIINKHMLEVE